MIPRRAHSQTDKGRQKKHSARQHALGACIKTSTLKIHTVAHTKGPLASTQTRRDPGYRAGATYMKSPKLRKPNPNQSKGLDVGIRINALTGNKPTGRHALLERNAILCLCSPHVTPHTPECAGLFFPGVHGNQISIRGGRSSGAITALFPADPEKNSHRTTRWQEPKFQPPSLLFQANIPGCNR